jgi:lipoprotein NlpI
LYDASDYFIHLHRAGAPDKAREYIAGRSGELENDDWIAPLVQFYAGEITEDSLLSRTGAEDPDTDKGQKCEAYYYLGMGYLLGIHSSVPADTAKAIDYFEKCLGTNVVSYNEYKRAGRELRLLKAR